MTIQAANLDAMEVEALQTDRYLEALLAAVERRAADVPADATVDPTLRRAARRLRDELVRTHPSFRFEERLARRLADAAVRMRLATAAGGEAEAALIPFPTPLLADPMLVAELANPELAALLGVRDTAALMVDEAAAGAMAASAALGLEADTGAIATGPAARDTTAEPGNPTAAAGTATFMPFDALTAPLRPAGARPLLVGGALTSAALSLAGAAFVAWRLTRGAPADPMARAVRAARAAREAATATTTRLTAAGLSATTGPVTARAATRAVTHAGNAAVRPGRPA
jgi:hypothetical protein